MLKKILKWLGISIVGIISLFLIVILVLSSLEKVIYKDFYSRVTESVAIRGLETQYVPQGFCYSDKENVYITSGYMNKDSGASRLYVISEDDSTSKYVELQNINGKPFTGHVGGVACSKNNIWIASGSYIYQVYLSDLISASDGSTLKIIEKYEVDAKPSFTFVKDDYLYVGEFYREGKYPTDESHHLDIGNGKFNRALCFAYPLNENGMSTFIPEFTISIPDKVQGMCITDSGKIAATTSWGISNSHLYIYNNWKNGNKTFRVDDINIPLYILDESNMINDVVMPPMSEELEYKDGKILINFESAGKKYKAVNIYRQKNILAYAID